MGLNRNINDDSTLAYLFNKTRQGASDALQKAIDAINATIATIQTALANKVDKSGDTMTGELRINDNNFVIKNNVADITAASISAQQNNWYRVYDKNGRILVNLDGIQETDGTSKARIFARNQGTGTSIDNSLTLGVAHDGTRTVSVTQPSAWRDAIGAVNIAGDTMTGNLTISNGSPGAYADATSKTDGVAPSSDTNSIGFRLRDKNGNNVAMFTDRWNADGRQGAFVSGARNGVYNALYLLVDSSGDRVVSVSDAAPWRTALGLGTSGALPITIAQGGTGATSASGARSELGLGSVATENTVPIGKGGTNATTAANARKNLELCYAANDTMTISSSMVLHGLITNTALTYMYFDVPVAKSMENISTITATTMTGWIGGVNGAINGTSSNTNYIGTGYTVSCAKQGNTHVRIGLVKSSAFTNATAYSPVTYFGTLTLKFT